MKAKINWKTKEEIEADKHKPKPPTEKELMQQQINDLTLALGDHILTGGA